MSGKTVVLLMIILMGVTGHEGTAKAGILICEGMKSVVGNVWGPEENLDALPVPDLHLSCNNNGPAGPATLQITWGLPVVSTPELIQGVNGYQAEVSGNVTTFRDIEIPQGVISFDINNITLNGRNGVPYVPISAKADVATQYGMSSYSAVIGIIGKGGNDGSATFGTDLKLRVPYGTAFGLTFGSVFSFGQSETGGNYFSLDDLQLTSSSKWNNFASFSLGTKGRIFGIEPDIRSYLDDNSYAAFLRYDPLDQPFPGRISFKLDRLLLNVPFSNENATKIAAGAMLGALDEAKTYSALADLNTAFGMTQVGGPTVRYVGTIGGYFDVACKSTADDNVLCSSTFNNFLTPDLSLNGVLQSTAKRFNPSPTNWTVNLYDFQVKTPLSDLNYNMSMSVEEKSDSNTTMERDLVVNGFGTGTYNLQGNPMPYSLKKFDLHARVTDDTSTNVRTFDILSGRTWNSCSGVVFSPKTVVGYTFSGDYSRFLGGSLALTNAYSNDTIDAVINQGGSFSINLNGMYASTANDKDALDTACLAAPSGAMPELSVTPSSLSVDHKIGKSPCPTPIGDVTVANTGDPGSTLSWSLAIKAGSDYVNVSKTSGSVPGGDTDKFSVAFNCNVSGPGIYLITITVTGRDSVGNVVGTRDITITVNVS
jgi:hypothetical protein